MIGFDKLDKLVNKTKASPVNNILFLFWERGIDYNAFSELPLPYIFQMIKVFMHVKEEEAKAMKKQQRK
jgi:hypothetical protein